MKTKKEDKNINKFMKKVIGLDGLIYTGEAIRDIVLTFVVISIVIKYTLITNLDNNIAVFFICFGIMLVPISTLAKWLDRILNLREKQQ